jgi:hypothetical protein
MALKKVLGLRMALKKVLGLRMALKKGVWVVRDLTSSKHKTQRKKST